MVDSTAERVENIFEDDDNRGIKEIIVDEIQGRVLDYFFGAASEK